MKRGHGLPESFSPQDSPYLPPRSCRIYLTALTNEPGLNSTIGNSNRIQRRHPLRKYDRLNLGFVSVEEALIGQV